ncbi:MAG: hypothetical protein ABIU20_03735 [Blastocatellia bacterium]
MNDPQKIRQVNAIVQVLNVVGLLFFIAMAFGVITWKYAMFGGMACFVIAPSIKRITIGQSEES